MLSHSLGGNADTKTITPKLIPYSQQREYEYGNSQHLRTKLKATVLVIAKVILMAIVTIRNCTSNKNNRKISNSTKVSKNRIGLIDATVISVIITITAIVVAIARASNNTSDTTY